MCLQGSMHMQTIEKIVAWDVDDIQTLNPVYKTTYIPNTYPKQCITGPLEKIGLLVSLEDSLYALERKLYGSGGISVPVIKEPVPTNPDQIVVSHPTDNNKVAKTTVITTVKYTYHKVKTGENLGKIAAQYNVSIQNIMEWNNLSSTQITVGTLLKIQTFITTTVENPEVTEPSNTTLTDTLPEKDEPPVAKQNPVPVKKKYYTIRSGDSFAKIAGRHGITVTQLKKLNPGVNPGKIRAGQKLRVK
jgi:membrane-bound lytic murein transglycosylase D